MKSTNETLKNYKNKKTAIKHDSDGFYILVSGAVKLTNKIDRGTHELALIALNDLFGESRFLVEPSHSYFGDLIAGVPPPKEINPETEVSIV